MHSIANSLLHLPRLIDLFWPFVTGYANMAKASLIGSLKPILANLFLLQYYQNMR